MSDANAVLTNGEIGVRAIAVIGATRGRRIGISDANAVLANGQCRVRAIAVICATRGWRIGVVANILCLLRLDNAVQ